MTKRWQRQRKNDQYYKQAKTKGYRSRAAYKLKQIHDRFKIFRRGDIVLDLGAAPGGWSQVAGELVGENGVVIGVDLDHISPINSSETVKFIVGDITEPGLINTISDLTDDRKINVIISDAAPNITGNYSMDQAKSIYLAESVLNIAKQLLNANGKLIIKVFEGEDFKQFFNELKNHFFKVRRYSPKASRARSSEIYVIGFGFKN
jgi:23S rRNA (uridine2552-2'-O)-methyltransferase